MTHDPADRRTLLRVTFGYSLCLGGLLCLAGLRYLALFAWPEDGVARLYAALAWLSHFALLGMAPWLLGVLPFTLVRPLPRTMGAACVTLGALMLAFVQIDSLVFAADRFHIDVLALQVLGPPTWSFAAMYLAIGLALCALVLRVAWRRLSAPPYGRRAALLGVALAAAFVVAQSLHAWADVRFYVPITSFTPYLPLYRPLTAKHLLGRFLGAVNLERARQARSIEELAGVQTGVLDYPKAPLRCEPPASPLNVLAIGIDAMRADMVDERVAPHIHEFARQAMRFESHRSGGNGTRPGLFSFFYGVPATYWGAFYAAQQPPVLIETFQAHGYQVAAFPSNPADRLVGLERTAFRTIADLPTTTGDVAVTKGWTRWLAEREPDRPFFAFLFFESPPGGCRPEYERVSDVDVAAPGDAGRRACYETAVHFADAQVGRVLEALAAAHLTERTVVLITSDHGEEFDETGQGFRGHGSSYSRYQLATPMLIDWPGRDAGVASWRTSHNDVAPTLLEDVLGCTNPPSDYSSGKNLFDRQSWDWLIAASYTSHAILEPDRVTISYGRYYEVRDRDYRLIEDPELDAEVLGRAIRETGRFLKR